MPGPWLVTEGEMEIAVNPASTRRTVPTLIALELDAEFLAAYRATFAEREDS